MIMKPYGQKEHSDLCVCCYPHGSKKEVSKKRARSAAKKIIRKELRELQGTKSRTA